MPISSSPVKLILEAPRGSQSCPSASEGGERQTKSGEMTSFRSAGKAATASGASSPGTQHHPFLETSNSAFPPSTLKPIQPHARGGST